MINVPENIYLVGLMGAGKTTIGRQLARRIRRPFLDADHELERRMGVKVPIIFEIEGEPGFRDRETHLLEELSVHTDLVLATGGGVVMREENRNLLRKSGLVIYLHVPPRLLYERTRHDTNRPLLQVADPMKKLEELYILRDPLYREVADIVINSQGGNISHLLRQVERELQQRCAA